MKWSWAGHLNRFTGEQWTSRTPRGDTTKKTTRETSQTVERRPGQTPGAACWPNHGSLRLPNADDGDDDDDDCDGDGGGFGGPVVLAVTVTMMIMMAAAVHGGDDDDLQFPTYFNFTLESIRHHLVIFFNL